MLLALSTVTAIADYGSYDGQSTFAKPAKELAVGMAR